MRNVSLEQLSQGLLAIRTNAINLLEDARLLRAHGRQSRAYALAYMACEEFGKLPILVGIATRLALGIPVDWKQAGKRFQSHSSKASQFFGLAHAMPMLLEAVGAGGKVVDGEKLMRKAAVGAVFGPSLFASRNAAVYCDFEKDAFVSPSERINEEMVETIFAFAEINQIVADTLFGKSADEVVKMIRERASHDRYEENQSQAAHLIEEVLAAMESKDEPC